MTRRNHPGVSAGMTVDSPAPDRSPVVKKRHRWLRGLGIFLLLIAALVGVARLLLPSQLRKYVNRTLDRNQLYEGRIGDVQVHLLRGAYSIHEVGDLKASLDRLKIPNKEQKELLAIVESTRPQIVTKR